MRILGLTGSIATGKTNAADTFDAFGIPVFDADATVHALYEPGGAAVAPLVEAFGPGILDPRGGIDRRRLVQLVRGDAAAWARLDTLVHPLVREAELRFLESCARAGCPLVVLDIPLLFETGGERRCDRVAVVTCHPLIQEQRALRRPGMTRELLDAVRARQMSEAEKRRRADYIVPTGEGRGATLARIRTIVLDMLKVRPRVWPERWLRTAALQAWRRTARA